MKREIKFRAWDENNKYIVPDFDNWLDFKGQYWTIPDRTYDTPNIEIVKMQGIILMQYTGLTDKFGKEIYEGDIVNIDGLNVKVEWYNGAWTVEYFTSPQRSYLSVFDETDVEIIGNIYENQNLIE